MIPEVILDALLDTVKLTPFLFLTYLVMEYLEHKTKNRSKQIMKKSGSFGPLMGGVVGAFPQCGFSAAAASLYSGGVISAGTLLAIFLSTSDEMLPIFISEAVKAGTILRILGLKIVLGTVSGFAIDILWRSEGKKEIHDLCESEHCHCENGSIIKSSVMHTLQITLFIFLVSLVIGFCVELAGRDAIGYFISGKPIVGVFLAALVGLIPNCASSVVITQLYLIGILGAGQMMAGLLVGAGVGILVLCRTNRGMKENLGLIGILYGTGVFWGIVIEVLGISL